MLLVGLPLLRSQGIRRNIHNFLALTKRLHGRRSIHTDAADLSLNSLSPHLNPPVVASQKVAFPSKCDAWGRLRCSSDTRCEPCKRVVVMGTVIAVVFLGVLVCVAFLFFFHFTIPSAAAAVPGWLAKDGIVTTL